MLFQHKRINTYKNQSFVQLINIYFKFAKIQTLFCGEGNGNPLQDACLENPMDRGARCATVHTVVKSRTRQKQLSTHTHTHTRTLF